MALVGALIAIVGVIFFNWQIGQVVFLFFWDMLFIGATTVLRMIFAMGGQRSFFQGLLLRLFFTGGFVVLYASMMMLLIAFVMSGLHLETFLANYNGLQYGVWFLAFNHLAGFLFGYILNDAYKQSVFSLELFATFFFALPTVAVLVLLVAPNSAVLGVAQQNAFIGVAIILVKLVMELFAGRMRNVLYRQNITPNSN